MSLPKGYLPHEGDILTLHGRVRFSVTRDDGMVHLEILGAMGKDRMIVDLPAIAGLHCRTWSPGDKVRATAAPTERGEVIAIHENFAWVRLLDGGSLGTIAANELEPDDEPDPIAPAPEPEIIREETSDE